MPVYPGALSILLKYIAVQPCRSALMPVKAGNAIDRE